VSLKKIANVSKTSLQALQQSLQQAQDQNQGHHRKDQLPLLSHTRSLILLKQRYEASNHSPQTPSNKPGILPTSSPDPERGTGFVPIGIIPGQKIDKFNKELSGLCQSCYYLQAYFWCHGGSIYECSYRG